MLLLSASLQWGKGYVPLWQLSLRILYMFDSIFAKVVWIDKLHYFHEETYFPENCCHRNRKNAISVVIVTVATRKESLVKNLNLIDSNYYCKNWIDWIRAWWEKISQPQKCWFLRKGNERQKRNNFTIHDNLPQFRS